MPRYAVAKLNMLPGDLVGNVRRPDHERARITAPDLVPWAEDGIGTRDPLLGKVIEIVNGVQAIPLSWPPVCRTSTESARIQLCCRTVYYEVEPFIPTAPQPPEAEQEPHQQAVQRSPQFSWSFVNLRAIG
jgi:hypothetical protein